MHYPPNPSFRYNITFIIFPITIAGETCYNMTMFFYKDSTHSVPVGIRWLVIAGFVTLFAAAWMFLTSNIPWEDDYDAILKYLVLPPNERWKHLLDLHNEHRIATTRLIVESIFAICGQINFRVCMLIGNGFMLLLAAIWYRKFRKIGHEWAGLAIFTLSLSLLHWANQLNALCANQNILAVLLPFLALLTAERAERRFFAASMGLAVLSTFTSGSGMFVWPALFLSECAGSRRKTRLALISAIALLVVAFYFSLPNANPPQIVKDVAQPGETILAKTTVMGYTIEVTPMFILRHIAFATNYFFACVGGVVVMPWLNVVTGIALCITATYLTATFQRIKSRAVWGLMVYLLGSCASCGIFRAASFTADVPSRYQVVCVSLLAAILYLVLERLPSAGRPIRLERYLCLVSVVASISYFVYAAPILHTRAEIHRRNILLWPKSDMGLRYFPNEKKAHASEILKKSVKRGVYSPLNASYHEEPPPSAPLSDITPRF